MGAFIKLICPQGMSFLDSHKGTEQTGRVWRGLWLVLLVFDFLLVTANPWVPGATHTQQAQLSRGHTLDS